MASYFPMVKNSAQRIVFPILDADGDPVTGADSDTPDSEYSLDGGSFQDITDEIHELATASGVYYLDLTTDETNGDVVTIQVKTATAGTKTTVLVFYTSAQSLDTMDANVDTLLTRLSSVRAGYLDQLDFNLQEAIATLQTDLDNPSQYKADLSTLETRLSATRAGYLDQLDFALQEAIAAIPTTMVGTNNVVLSGPTKAQMDAALLIMKQKVAGTYDRETDSLEALRDRGDSDWITGGGGSAADIADAVWDEDITEHTAADSAGEALADATEITLEED